MESNQIDTALARAATALAAMSTSVMQKLPLLDCTLVLGAVPDDHTLHKVRKRLAGRLQSRLSASWIESGDLYDVFLILTSLWKYDPSYISGEHLACAVQRLIHSEVAVGGPYYSDNTIVPNANAQIALFMRHVAQPLPNVDAFLAETVVTKQLGPPEVPLSFLAEATAHPRLTQYVADHWRQKEWQTPQRTAISLAILQKRAQTSVTNRALLAICGMQRSDGLWSAEPLSPEVPVRADSPYATTAIIAGALSERRHKTIEAPLLDLQRHHHTVEQAARVLLGNHHEPLRSTALAMTSQVCSADKNFEITLLPRLFGRALKKHVPLTSRQYTALGVANLFVWIAYTIYDDFLDDEGIADQLPTANLTLRASFAYFQRALPVRTEMQEYIAHTFDAMDEANAWEVNNCRFTVQAGIITIPKLPHYRTGRVLAERSFAHALAPMLILLHSSLTQTQRRNVESALRHYLIARQLDDDLRDWQEDVTAGQASYVVTAILRSMQTLPGTYDLRTLLPTMQKRFRQTTMPEIARRILEHISASRRDFAKSQLMRTTNDVYALLDTIEVSARHSLDKRAKSLALSKAQKTHHDIDDRAVHSTKGV